MAMSMEIVPSVVYHVDHVIVHPLHVKSADVSLKSLANTLQNVRCAMTNITMMREGVLVRNVLDHVTNLMAMRMEIVIVVFPPPSTHQIKMSGCPISIHHPLTPTLLPTIYIRALKSTTVHVLVSENLGLIKL
jgi:hypothetical protein